MATAITIETECVDANGETLLFLDRVPPAATPAGLLAQLRGFARVGLVLDDTAAHVTARVTTGPHTGLSATLERPTPVKRPRARARLRSARSAIGTAR